MVYQGITYKGGAVYKDGNRLGKRKAELVALKHFYRALEFGRKYGSSQRKILQILSVPAHLIGQAHAGLGAVAINSKYRTLQEQQRIKDDAMDVHSHQWNYCE